MAKKSASKTKKTTKSKPVKSKSKSKSTKSDSKSKTNSAATQKLVNALFTKNMDDLVIALSENADANHIVTKKDGTKLFPVLHKAVENNDKTAVELLLESGADPNGQGERNNILQGAMLYGDGSKTNFKIIDILLDAGANPLKQNKHGFHAKSTAGFIERKKNNSKYLEHITAYLDNNPDKTRVYVEELRKQREKNMDKNTTGVVGRTAKRVRGKSKRKSKARSKRKGKRSKSRAKSKRKGKRSKSRAKSKRKSRSKKGGV